MKDEGPSRNFILGNLLLGSALIMLLFMGTLWEHLGSAAMGVWIAVAATGAYLLMSN